MIRRSSILHHLVLAMAFAAVVPTATDAQGSIRGVVWDSLRTHRPVEGARVTLQDGTATLSDADGAFRFDDVPAGTHTVSWRAPWFDSFGLETVSRQVRVRAGRESDIALISLSTREFLRLRCEDHLEREQGVVVGRVVDAGGRPRAGVTVRVTWLRDEDFGAVERAPDDVIISTSDAEGRYSVCGVPRRTTVRVAAAAGVDSAGPMQQRADGRAVLHQELVLSRGGMRAAVTGRVINAEGRPVWNAAVRLIGDTTRHVRTNADGEFAIPNVPVRSQQLMIVAAGHVDWLHTMQPFDGSLTPGDVVVQADSTGTLIFALGQLMTREEREFEERRLMYRGRYFDERYFSRVASRDAFSFAGPEIFPQSRGRFAILFLRPSGRALCRPQIVVNGRVTLRNLEPNDEEALYRRMVRAEIHVAPLEPPEFDDPVNCGTVVLWER